MRSALKSVGWFFLGALAVGSAWGPLGLVLDHVFESRGDQLHSFQFGFILGGAIAGGLWVMREVKHRGTAAAVDRGASQAPPSTR